VRALATALLLAAALATLGVLQVPMVAASHGDFDALHLYLPLARGLLADGLAFFANPDSLQAPPFSYVYPALLGASLPAVKLANGLLSGLTLLAIFRGAWLVHSRAAGVLAAFFFALSPTLRPHLATPITEGPYLFLCAAWFCGVAEWWVHGRRWALAAAAVAICLAALTRATMFYALVALALGMGTLAWCAQAGLRSRMREAALAHALALLPIAAFIAKNALLFGFAFFATGGGNALFLGNNPLTGGFDPNYLGLYFDVGAIARDQSHLSLAAERLLSGAARLAIHDQSLAALAELHLRKLAAFVFVTGAEIEPLAQRSWRIAMLVLAAGALPTRRAHLLRWLLFAMLAVQVALHVPVLYTHRYSVDAMDGWLVIAAAVGLARWALERRALALVAATLLAAIGIAAGVRQQLEHRPARMPDVFAAKHVTVWQAPRPLALTSAQPAIEIPFGDAPRLNLYFNHVLVIEATSGTAHGFGCDRLGASFRATGAAEFSPEVSFNLRPDGRARRYQFGTVPLALAPAGTVRLTARCAAASAMTVERIALVAAMGADDYRRRLEARAAGSR
jgi:hypothetical protein